MSDEQVSFKLDLDARDATKSLLSFKDNLAGLADSKSVGELIKGFTQLTGPIVIAGAALFSLKKSFDFALEGEQLLRIENQFKNIADTAGVSSEKILDGIEKATKGTIDQSDAMKLATDSILKLGGAASKIPEIMELARKAAMATGGDTAQVFEQLNFAISTGNTRILKRMGLSYDANEAEKKYAAGIGKVTSELSEQEKIQARINGLLDVGNKKLKDSGDNAQPLADSIARLKNAFNDLYENTTKFFAQNFARGFSMMTDGVTAFIKSLSGDKGQEIKNLEEGIVKAQAAWFELYKTVNKKSEDKSWVDNLKDFARGGVENSLKLSNAELNLAAQNIEKLEARLKALKGDEKTSDAGPSGSPEVDPAVQEAALANKSKFEQELLQLSRSRVEAELAIETDANNYTALQEQQELLLKQEYYLKINDLQREASEGKWLSEDRANQLIDQLEQEREAKLRALKMRQNDERIQMFDNQLKAAKNTAEGMQAAFGSAAARATKDLQDYGKRGQIVFNAINGGAQNFFKSLGSGSKDAGDLMKGFLFNAIADIAEAQGQMLLASGIGTLNPIQIVQGGALLALSGLLRSQAGGGASGGVGNAGGGGGGGASGFAAGPGGAGPVRPEAAEAQKKSVTVQFMGDYLETEQTQKRIVELIRRETDATDFKYEQIPVR